MNGRVPSELAARNAGFPAGRFRDIRASCSSSGTLGLTGGNGRLENLPTCRHEGRRYLADEPTGHFDSHTGDESIELLLAFRAERQTTLIIATHSTELAARAPRVIQMLDGSVVAEIC